MSDHLDHRIDELLELAGLGPQSSSSTLARGVLESIESQRPLETDIEFAKLLQQIPARSPEVR